METVVVVEWYDAHQGTEGWTAMGDVDTNARLIVTCGFLWTEDDGAKEDHVTVVQSQDRAYEMVDNVLHIPVAMVKCLTVFERSGAQLRV